METRILPDAVIRSKSIGFIPENTFIVFVVAIQPVILILSDECGGGCGGQPLDLERMRRRDDLGSLVSGLVATLAQAF
jgi:hypothetical protein